MAGNPWQFLVLWLHLFSFCLHLNMVPFPLCVSVSKVPSSLKDTTLVIGFRTHPNSVHLILTWPSAKILFPSEVPFPGKRLWGVRTAVKKSPQTLVMSPACAGWPWQRWPQGRQAQCRGYLCTVSNRLPPCNVQCGLYFLPVSCELERCIVLAFLNCHNQYSAAFIFYAC